MAAKGFAPELLAHAVVVPSERPVHAIVMADLRHKGFIPASDVEWKAADVESVCDTIGRMLRAVHEAGFVMGDVREPNMMVRLGDGDDREVRLIDFEFTRRIGEPWPNVNYNPKLTWPPELAAAMGFSEEDDDEEDEEETKDDAEEEEEEKDDAGTSGQKLPCMKPEHDLFMLAEMRTRMMPATVAVAVQE